MQQSVKSIRPFIGSKDFRTSSEFYNEIGFTETILEKNLTLFTASNFSFYLQDYYVKEWVANTMLFIEVDNVFEFHQQLLVLNLPNKYVGSRIDNIRDEHWGNAFALIDPAGILWHIGQFKTN